MFNIIRTDVRNQHFNFLISKLDADLSVRYSTDQEKFSELNKMEEGTKVVVAFKDDVAVGCGCFRSSEDSEVAELKRMYVMPAFRGLGIAGMILSQLEGWAKENGHIMVKLETGIKQPEAISLYSKFGYSRIENYGPYKHIPESICMAKSLT